MVTETTYKIVLLGDGGVGKTALLMKLIHGEFQKKYISTIGAVVHPLHLNTNHGDITLHVWDTAGQEKFGGLREGYYINSPGAILLGSHTSRASCKNLGNWMRDFYKTAPKEAPAVIYVTKSDCESQVNKLHINDVPIKDISCSVRLEENLFKPFEDILREITGYSDLKILNEIGKVGRNYKLDKEYNLSPAEHLKLNTDLLAAAKMNN